MRQDIVCGLDIGSSSIRAVIAQSVNTSSKEDRLETRSDKEKILGFSESLTKGFSKGIVSNLNLLSDSIEEAMSKAEDVARCRVRKVITNISGVHIRTFKSRGSIHISDKAAEITKDDLTRCIDSAKLIAMSLDREIVHLIPEQFYIDDKLETAEPLGLYGSKLDVDLNIITTLVSILQNLTKAINLSGYEVEDVVVSSTGTSLAIFNHKELEEGAIIIDIGKDTAEVSVFMDGKLRDCFYFPFGSDDLTQVLQDKLKIRFEEAEELRIRYGILAKDASKIYDDTEIVLSPLKNRPGLDNEETQSDRDRSGGNWVDSEMQSKAWSHKETERVSLISRRDISNLLFPKLEQIMQDVYKKIEPFLKQRKRLPHIRVVGGISKMDGFVEAVEEVFGVSVDMGILRNVKELHDINFACSLGLARYGVRKRLEKKVGYLNTGSVVGRFISRMHELFSEYF
jgi:cell division protein FtsA